MSEHRFLWDSAPRMLLAQSLLALALSGCKAAETEPRTEILLQIDADSQVRARAEHLTIELASGAASGEALTESDAEVFDLDGDDFHWPASLALVAKAGHENHVFEATITADAKGMPLTRARVRSAFLKGKTLLLSTSLFGQCIEKFDCADDETCVGTSGGATCVTYVVDQTQLPVFRPTAQAGSSAADGGDAASPPQTNDSGASAQAGRAGNTNTPMAGAGSVAPPHAGAAGAPSAGANAAGSGGRGGVVPIAGRTTVSGISSSGANAAGGGAGTVSVPVCVPSGAEQCWNNVDDDCNGATDCEDNACTAGSVCLPSSGTLGVLVPSATPCPSDYAQGQMPLYQGLMDNGCSGCSCSSTATQCLPHVYYYATTSACTSDSVMPYTGGTLINTVPTYTCSNGPLGESQPMQETPVAWRVTMGVVPGTCSASGGATPLAPVWATQMKLCTRTTGGGGCAPGSVCLPKVTGAQTCVQKPDPSGCLGSMTAQVWKRGYSDNRSCGPCSCAANGGDCNNVSVQLGHDWSCGSIDGTLHGGQKSCSISTYAPPAILAGLPTNPSCTASAPINGTLTETAPLELCCAP